LNPKQSDIYNNRGNSKLKLDKLKDAIKDFDKAIELKNDFAIAYYNRGVAKLQSDDKNNACKDWQKAKKLGLNLADELINKYCK
jgi:tetratricopeptide (TPR) repeat protein